MTDFHLPDLLFLGFDSLGALIKVPVIYLFKNINFAALKMNG
ncbi:MAG: hypothetical protein ACM3RX_02580 [Methanococcaceae archaeon]